MHALVKPVFGIVCAIGVSSCIHSDPRREPVVKNTYYGSQMFFDQRACRYTPSATVNLLGSTNPAAVVLEDGEVAGAESTALLAAVLPSLVDKGVDLAIGFLKEQEKNLTATSTAHTFVAIPANMTQNDAKNTEIVGCFTYVRGLFGEPQEVNPPSSIDEGIGLAARPDFVSEFLIIRPAGVANAVFLQPVFLKFQRTAAIRGDDKQILVSVSLTAPTVKSGAGSGIPALPGAATVESEAKAQLASFAFGFDWLKEDAEIPFEHLKGHATPLSTLQSSGGKGLPAFANATITVVETEDAGDLLRAVISLAETNQAEISQDIQKRLKKLLDIID